MVVCSMLIDKFGMCFMLRTASMCILNPLSAFVKVALATFARFLSFDLLYKLQRDVTSCRVLNWAR